MSLPEVTGRGGTSPFDAIRQTRPDGTEFWSARDLCQVVEYETWRNFAAAIDRAKLACENSGSAARDHFVGASKMIDLGKGGRREVEDFNLSRFGAYLTVMNGDPRKSTIADAQAYFAIQTRVAETKPALTGADLFAHAVLEAKAMIEERDRMIASQDAQISQLAPKAAYVDEFVADDDLLRFATVASTLGMQECKLRELLIEKGWIFVEESSRWSNSKNRKVIIKRYSEYATKKPYFRRVEQHEAPRFRGEVMHTLKITPPGAEAIARMVRRSGGNVIDLFEGDE